MPKLSVTIRLCADVWRVAIIIPGGTRPFGKVKFFLVVSSGSGGEVAPSAIVALVLGFKI
jgi:hypothetical protein